MDGPLVMHQPGAPLIAEVEAWVERYLESFPGRFYLLDDAVEVPGDAVAELLASCVTGRWELRDDEVARLWFLGRALGWRPKELLADAVLAEALPGRDTRPVDPPGRYVHDIVLGGGGHGAGTGLPGKREFPASWSGEQVLERVVDLARDPQLAVELPHGDVVAYGERAGVAMGVVLSPAGRVLTGYPVAGEGVEQNPLADEQRPVVAVLESLLRALPLPADDEPRATFDELCAVGEWPYVVESLLVMDVPWTHEQRVDLANSAEASGVEIPDWFLYGDAGPPERAPSEGGRTFAEALRGLQP